MVATMAWEIPSFPLEEKERRYRALWKEMGSEGVDCVVVAGHNENYGEKAGNLRYVANYAPWFEDEYVVFPLKGEPLLLCLMDNHASWARRISWIKQVEVARHWSTTSSGAYPKSDYVRRMAEYITDLGYSQGKIGICDLGTMPALVYLGLRDALPQAELVDVGQLFSRVRMVKSDIELQFVEKAAECADIGFQAMLEAARPGATEYTVWASCDQAMVSAGAGAPSFTAMCSFSSLEAKGSGMPHGGTRRVMQAGDMIMNHISPSYGGYWVELIAPISLGPSSIEFQKLCDLHKEIYYRTLDKMRPGITVREIQENAQRIAWAGGADRTKSWVLQHLGLYLHDSLPPETALQPNMTFMVHPSTQHGGGAYGGHFAGNTVVVTAHGARSLSRTPVQLHVK